MIEYIECFKPEQEFYKYTKENYLDFIKTIFPSYYYNYRSVVNWKYKEKKYNFTNKIVKHIPLKEWDGIAFIMDDYKTIIICNPDTSIRFKINVPKELIQREEYDKHFEISEWKSKEIDKDYYVMEYERFDDYFEYNGKYYLSVLVGKFNENENFDAYLQMRYLDCDTGEFLPFTKKIVQRIPSPYDYYENVINI